MLLKVRQKVSVSCNSKLVMPVFTEKKHSIKLYLKETLWSGQIFADQCKVPHNTRTAAKDDAEHC